MSNKPCVSLFFPVYRDELTVRRVTEKALAVLSEVAEEYEVIIVDDGSPDRAGEIADELAAEYPCVSVVHHPRNLGYGAAIKSGLSRARFEWICFTDGDDEYDVFDLHKLIALKDFYDLVITFRYVKVYSGSRQLISWVYNSVLRVLFRTHYRDISTGLRLVRKSLIDQITCESNSPFIGAEITIKSMLKGYRVGEVGIQTFPREFGAGASTSLPNILATIRDMTSVYRTVFSADYDLPPNRSRR
ncbi:MAG TPA: glycosyltransferase family 2 protein [Polyangiaceae bacterium]|nr:glycosyltransferase family 2 protein [Polyangiaceae bacterium]